MNGYIYKYTFLPTNKIYIGQHKSDTFDESYYGSGSVWKSLIKDVDKSLIKREILEWCYNTTKEHLTSRENYWIEKLCSMDSSIGYNQCKAVPNFWEGHNHTDDTKEKIRSSSFNRRFLHKDGIVIGVEKSEVESYLELGWKSGTGIPRVQSEETKQLISESNSNKVRLTNGVENVFIKKDKIEEYLNKGFVPGITVGGIPRITRMMTDGKIEKKVNHSNQQSFIERGWKFGSLSDYNEEELSQIYNNVMTIKSQRLIERGKNISKAKIGHTVSEETREKLRAHNLGKTMSEESRKKLSTSNMGRKHSDETKRKISSANKGRNFTDEHRRKLSEAHKNSQSNHIWITNGEITKRVTLDTFKSVYESQGFVQGRRINNE